MMKRVATVITLHPNKDVVLLMQHRSRALFGTIKKDDKIAVAYGLDCPLKRLL